MKTSRVFSTAAAASFAFFSFAGSASAHLLRVPIGEAISGLNGVWLPFTDTDSFGHWQATQVYVDYVFQSGYYPATAQACTQPFSGGSLACGATVSGTTTIGWQSLNLSSALSAWTGHPTDYAYAVLSQPGGDQGYVVGLLCL